MSEGDTIAAVQSYLDELAGNTPAEPIIRALLDRVARRLHLLCVTLLHRCYPHLTRPPLNVQADELLGAVTERLLRALREARPQNVRRFFALANQHMRSELDDLSRRFDAQSAASEHCEGNAVSQVNSLSGLTPDSHRLLQAISELPDDEREAFDLVRVQGMTHTEAAQVLGVSTGAVKRWLSRGVQLLAEQLADPRACQVPPDST
jgi:RNA polymerase sigma-70 factor (ECF subfamily)